MSRCQLKALKRHSENEQWLQACQPDDPEATHFQVSYPGMPFSCSQLEFDNRYRAERTMEAIDAAFAAGQREAFKELRRLIGAKDA